MDRRGQVWLHDHLLLNLQRRRERDATDQAGLRVALLANDLPRGMAAGDLVFPWRDLGHAEEAGTIATRVIRMIVHEEVGTHPVVAGAAGELDEAGAVKLPHRLFPGLDKRQ